MATEQEVRSKDNWDKLSILSVFLASVLVPIVITVVGNWYTTAIKDREVEISARDQKLREDAFNREWVQLGLQILRDPTTGPNIRKWGIQIISTYGKVPMEGDVQKDLTAGAVLPESSTPQVVTQQSVGSGDSTVSTTMSRSRALEEIQLRGIKSLLNRDLDGAIAAYNDAYSLWPTFRNVDEIRRALINAETAARSTPNGPDWQGIYKQVIQLDLRGLPTDVKQQLSQAANGTQ